VDGAGQFAGAVPVTLGTTRFTVTATDATANTAQATFDVDQTGTSHNFSYDLNGNITSDGTRTFEWDAQNRLKAVVRGIARTEFTYDGYSRRVGLTERDAGSIVAHETFLWCGGTICRSTDDSGSTTEYFTSGVRQGGLTLFAFTDHLGSLREVTDASGVLRARYDYDPWGKRLKVAGDIDVEIGFTGLYLHSASELYLALYRVYDPNTGGWLSEDPNGPDLAGNLYTYVVNSPYNYRDPLGLEEIRWDRKFTYGDPDTACAPKKTGGGCSKYGTAGGGTCAQQPNCKWKGKTFLLISVQMTIWPGPYPYKTGAVDRSVKDAASATAHEWGIHLLPAAAAARKRLKDFERKEFDTSKKCTRALDKAVARARRDFSSVAQRNPL